MPKNPKDSLALATKLTDIDKLVKKYQANLIEKHQGSLAAKIVRASVEPEPPEFKGAEKDALLRPAPQRIAEDQD